MQKTGTIKGGGEVDCSWDKLFSLGYSGTQDLTYASGEGLMRHPSITCFLKYIFIVVTNELTCSGLSNLSAESGHEF